MYQGFAVCTFIVALVWAIVANAGYGAWFVHTGFAVVAIGNLAFHASIMWDAVSKG